ncbi:MAG: RagB/SusD family nutrient uptake outer membrane protein [Gemmatimonadales bacterium]
MCLALVIASTGCQSLLEVELPGQLETAKLETPDNAALLAGAVVAEFECAFAKYILASSLIGNELNVSILTTHWWSYDQRALADVASGSTWASATCDQNEPAIYTSLSVARFLGDKVFGLLDGWTDAEVPGRGALLAQTAAYTGYTYLLFSEAMCAAVFDEGTEVTAAQIRTRAEERFTRAIALATPANRPDIVNMSLLGRARVKLGAGKKAEAAADAQLIPAGFVKNAQYSAAAGRSENRVFALNNRSSFVSIESIYHNLTFNGVPDRRVAVTNAGRLGADGRTPLFLQTKYAGLATPIPIARHAEARLIIAENAVATGNLTAAVAEINALHAAAGLPDYQGGTAAQVMAQIVEERQREFFLESHHYNDAIRYQIAPFPAPGTPHKFGGLHGGPLACLPVPSFERKS